MKIKIPSFLAVAVLSSVPAFHALAVNTNNGGAFSTIVDGDSNTITVGGIYSVIGAGTVNTASGNYSGILTGSGNTASGGYSVVAGGAILTASGLYSGILGGFDSQVTGNYSSMVGGSDHTVSGAYSGVVSGNGHSVSGNYSGILAGFNNTASGAGCVVGGGISNTASGAYSAILGGGYLDNGVSYPNTAAAACCGIVSGLQNKVVNTGIASFIGAGGYNTINGSYSSVPGGIANTVAGSYCAALGSRITIPASRSYVMVIGGRTDNAYVNLATTGQLTNGEVLLQAAGGCTVLSNNAGTAGVKVLPGSGSWVNLSARASKQSFASVNPGEVLKKVAALDVSTWQYKTEESGARHMGPIAEEFSEAFGLGADEHGIATVDIDGVALASIKGLKQENDALARQMAVKDKEIKEMRTEMEEQKKVLKAIQRRLNRNQ